MSFAVLKVSLKATALMRYIHELDEIFSSSGNVSKQLLLI